MFRWRCWASGWSSSGRAHRRRGRYRVYFGSMSGGGSTGRIVCGAPAASWRLGFGLVSSGSWLGARELGELGGGVLVLVELGELGELVELGAGGSSGSSPAALRLSAGGDLGGLGLGRRGLGRRGLGSGPRAGSGALGGRVGRRGGVRVGVCLSSARTERTFDEHLFAFTPNIRSLLGFVTHSATLTGHVPGGGLWGGACRHLTWKCHFAIIPYRLESSISGTQLGQVVELNCFEIHRTTINNLGLPLPACSLQQELRSLLRSTATTEGRRQQRTQ